jgi:hypothetical protein
VIAAAVLVAACDRRPPVTSCADDLHGVWVAPGDARWMMLDNGPTLEAYPMFPDATPDRLAAPELVVAPRVLDLARDSRGTLAGDLKRRYMRRADTCDARVPVHVTACKDDTLELVLADVVAPVTLGPCSWPAPQPSRVERWRRN